MRNSIENLLEGNKLWVDKTKNKDENFFDELSKGQSPDYLWIGCSDSRIPASQVTNSAPGAIFVQRNIANMVVNSDSNLLSVVYYAVEVLKVKHIIVCGHYQCGGVHAAMKNENHGLLDNWLVHIKNVYSLHSKELDAIEDERGRLDRFVELNIIEQVNNLSKISFIQKQWQDREFPYIHGWVYQLEDGLIKDLKVTQNSCEKLPKIFHYNKS